MTTEFTPFFCPQTECTRSGRDSLHLPGCRGSGTAAHSSVRCAWQPLSLATALPAVGSETKTTDITHEIILEFLNQI